MVVTSSFMLTLFSKDHSEKLGIGKIQIITQVSVTLKDEQQTVEARAGLQTDLHLQVESQTSPACVFIKEMEYAKVTEHIFLTEPLPY